MSEPKLFGKGDNKILFGYGWRAAMFYEIDQPEGTKMLAVADGEYETRTIITEPFDTQTLARFIAESVEVLKKANEKSE